MKAVPLWLQFVLGVTAIIALTTPPYAFADTYQIFDLNSDQGRFFYGMDNAGHVATDDGGGGPCFPNTCYFNFYNGVATGTTSAAPAFSQDNGSPCVPTLLAGGLVVYGVCNAGREAFTGYLAAGQGGPGIYTGPLQADLLAHGGDALIYMNGRGDIVWNDNFSDHFYEAVDLSTSPVPEPGSIILLGTGLAAIAGTIRRRLRRKHQASRE